MFLLKMNWYSCLISNRFGESTPIPFFGLNTPPLISQHILHKAAEAESVFSRPAGFCSAMGSSAMISSSVPVCLLPLRYSLSPTSSRRFWLLWGRHPLRLWVHLFHTKPRLRHSLPHLKGSPQLNKGLHYVISAYYGIVYHTFLIIANCEKQNLAKNWHLNLKDLNSSKWLPKICVLSGLDIDTKKSEVFSDYFSLQYPPISCLALLRT